MPKTMRLSYILISVFLAVVSLPLLQNVAASTNNLEGLVLNRGSVSTICGDVNGDGMVNSTDVIYLTNYLYKKGPTPAKEVGDVNADGVISQLDVDYLNTYLFKDGAAPLCNQSKAATCGDIIRDGIINQLDLDALAVYLLKGGPAPRDFIKADVNDDRKLDIADVVFLANYLFKKGPMPQCPASPVVISGAPGFQPCQYLPQGRNVNWACGLYVTYPSADIIFDTSIDPDFGSYRVYRAEHPDVTINDTFVGKITTQGSPENILFYRDNTLELDKTYYYRLFVFNKNSLSAGSNEIIIKTFSQTINQIPGIPEPGDTQYPPDVAIPYYTVPQIQYRCVEPDPLYYWSCLNYNYESYGPRVDELGQVYKYRYFRGSVGNNLLSNVSNLKFYLRNSEVWTTGYFAQDKDYTVSVPAYGFSINVPQNTEQTLQMQIFTGVFNIGLDAAGFSQPEAGTFYVSP